MDSAPGSPTATGIVVGTLGQLSTPELLAKRLQRQQAEREAAAAAHARPSMRRTLQPTQHQNVPQRTAASSQQSKMLGRSFRRPAEQQQQQQPAAAAAEPTGVSSDALARLLEAEAPPDEQPSKAIQLAAPCSSSSQQQPQPGTAIEAGSSSPVIKVCLLTSRQADASLGAAQQRLASIQEQKQQEAQAAAAAAAAMAEQARREREQSSAQAASDAAHSARWRYQPDEPDKPQQQQHQHQQAEQQQPAHGHPAGHHQQQPEQHQQPGQQAEQQQPGQQAEQQQPGQQAELQPPAANRRRRVFPLSFSAGAGAAAAAAPGSLRPPATVASLATGADAVAGPGSDTDGDQGQTLQAMMMQRQQQRQRKQDQQQERGGRAARAPGSRGPPAQPEQNSSSDEETLAAREARQQQQQQQQKKKQRARRQPRCRSAPAAAADPAGADSDGRDDQTLASLLEAKRQQQQQRQPKRPRRASSRANTRAGPAQDGGTGGAASGAAAPASRRQRPAAAASKQRLPRGLASLAAAVDAARQGSKRLQQLQAAAAAGPGPLAVQPPSSTRWPGPPAAQQRQQQQPPPPGLLQARAPAGGLPSCLPPELLQRLTGAAPAGPMAGAAAAGGDGGRVVLLGDADDNDLLDILPAATAAAGGGGGDGGAAAFWRVPQDAAAAAAAERQGAAGQSSQQEDEDQEPGWDSGSSSDGWQDDAGPCGSSSEDWDAAATAAADDDDGGGDGASDDGCDVSADSDGGGSSASEGGGRRKASRARKAAAARGRKGKATAAASRKARTVAAGVAPAASRKRRKAADADAGADDPAAAAAAKKPRRTKAAAAGTGSGAGRKKAPKTAHRNNFRRTKTGAGGYGTFKFMSKAGAAGGSRPFRRVINGRLIRGRRRAPHMAGQGAEFVDGFAAGGTTGAGRCFKCGQAGHWEQQCPLLVAKVAAQEAEMAAFISLQQEEQQGEPGSTQPQAVAAAGGSNAQQAAGAAVSAAAPQGYPQHRQQQQQAPEPPPKPLTHAQLCELAGVDPAAAWQPEALTDSQLLAVLTGVWGHASFRGQQLPLIRAALQGSSMLGVLPTGLGKSLTYQMPALLLQGLVVVVSPLLALMRDQVGRLPRGLPGAMLQGNMPRHEVEQVLARAESGGLRLLYVAPEKLTAPLVMATLQRLSPLPLVCVDEAHCMAEWGQGFRPAYFRLGHLLCNVLRPRAVLALTATATPATRACVRQLLAIPLEQQVVASPLRDNLRLQVLHCQAGAGKGGGIAAKITQMITTGELAGEASVVVYVSYKASADALAGQLQRATVAARPYHAGMSMAHREAVQAAFLSGTIRVVVATVAFGMGLDNPNLGAVLHASLPHSLEEYVQQVGRAGRDGRVARCFLFLDDAEYLRLRALAHSGLAEQHQVEAFLAAVFGRQPQQQAPAAAVGDKRKRAPLVLPPSRHRALPITATATELDLSSEVMEACLSFLQADPLEPLLTALPNCSATLDVRFHKTPPEQLAGSHPVVAAILAAKCRKYSGTHKVHLPALLAAADRPPGELLAELAGLAGQQEVGLDLGPDKVLAWRLERQPQDWQALVTQLTARLAQVQRAAVLRLDRCYAALASAAIYGGQQQQEAHLRGVIEAYFSEGAAEEAAGLGGEPAAGRGGPPPDDTQQQQQQQQQQAASAGGEDDDEDEGAGAMPWGGSDPVQRPPRAVLQRRVRAALHGIAARARDLGPGVFGGLALARFLAGLSSPRLPASTWKGCAEWGRLHAVDFGLLLAAARGAVQEFWDGEAEQKQQQQQRRTLPAG